jgi:phage terminase small subunit
MDGQPFLYVNKEVDPGLIATLKADVVPWLVRAVRFAQRGLRKLGMELGCSPASAEGVSE